MGNVTVLLLYLVTYDNSLLNKHYDNDDDDECRAVSASRPA